MRKKYLSKKNSALKSGYSFDLSFDEFKSLKLGDCHYCSSPNYLIKNLCDVQGLKTPWMTLDRKNNKVGYLSFNVVSCCFICNRIKGNFFTHAEMLDIGKKYVQPKMKLFEKEAVDAFTDEAENDAYLYIDEED